MIEFITLSKRPEKVRALEESLADTFGTGGFVHSVLDGAALDLFKGYNAGIRQARQDVLCLVHDDVLIRSNRGIFAQLERELGANRKLGFVGALGAITQLANGTSWEGLGPVAINEMHRGILEIPHAQEPGASDFMLWPTMSHQRFGRVVIVDGLLLLCHRSIFDQIGMFDEATFQGFHFYDRDITLRAHLAGLCNEVRPIHVFHESIGRPYSESWKAEREKFVQKWKHVLPVSVSPEGPPRVEAGPRVLNSTAKRPAEVPGAGPAAVQQMRVSYVKSDPGKGRKVINMPMTWLGGRDQKK